MSKAALIEYWRGTLLSDAAMDDYKERREDALAGHDLTDGERSSLLTDDYAELYRRGIPVELLFQVILLADVHPLVYMSKLHAGLGYAGPGLVTPEIAAASGKGSYTPSE